MRVFVATEFRIYHVGEDYYIDNAFRKILERYYKAFGDVTLCTRIIETEERYLPVTCQLSSDIISNTVAIERLEWVVFGKYDKLMRKAIDECSMVIARVPSIVAYRAAAMAKDKKIPYLIEAMGCAWDSYWNYSIKSKFLALPFFLMMRSTVKHANYATYVTERFLQERYPCNCSSIHASNVVVHCSEEGVMERRLEKLKKRDSKLVLLTAAAIDVAYKGQEFVIRAIKELREKGFDVEYRLAGSGNPERLKKIAAKCNVEDEVIFLGSLPHEGVLRELDNCDIYIQPSLQEGLPRSMIEAMSRGCPALGAHTAGIPELIAPECVFGRADPSAIVEAIVNICGSDMSKYAEMNYQKALEYDCDILEKRRNAFFKKIISEITNAT